jgi:hypothetical protein
MYKRTLIYAEPFLARRRTKVVCNKYAAMTRTFGMYSTVRSAGACNRNRHNP